MINGTQSLIDFSSVHEESNYSIEIERPQSKNMRIQLGGGAGATSLPNLHTSASTRSKDKSGLKAKSALANNKLLSEKNTEKAAMRGATGKYVVGKMKQDELRDFISHSLTKCRKGTFEKLNRENRDFNSVLASCVDLCSHPNYIELENERMRLAEELLSMPETFFGLRFMMKDVNNTFGIGTIFNYSPSADSNLVSMIHDLGEVDF